MQPAVRSPSGATTSHLLTSAPTGADCRADARRSRTFACLLIPDSCPLSPQVPPCPGQVRRLEGKAKSIPSRAVSASTATAQCTLSNKPIAVPFVGMLSTETKVTPANCNSTADTRDASIMAMPSVLRRASFIAASRPRRGHFALLRLLQLLFEAGIIPLLQGLGHNILRRGFPVIAHQQGH